MVDLSEWELCGIACTRGLYTRATAASRAGRYARLSLRLIALLAANRRYRNNCICPMLASAEYAWNVQDRPFAPSRKRRNRKRTDGVGRCNVRNSIVSFSSHTSDGAAARTSYRCFSISYFNIPFQRHTEREVRFRPLFKRRGMARNRRKQAYRARSVQESADTAMRNCRDSRFLIGDRVASHDEPSSPSLKFAARRTELILLITST